MRSAAADRDLLAIADYGIERWGIDSALDFIGGFAAAFALLGEHPNIGRERADLGEGIRSWFDRSYVIYYVRVGSEVIVGRILHGAADFDGASLTRDMQRHSLP